jgi:hypothetical protein
MIAPWAAIFWCRRLFFADTVCFFDKHSGTDRDKLTGCLCLNFW